MAESIKISVVIPTREPWPDLARCLEVLAPQVAALGGEIIVGDGHGGALDAVQAKAYPMLRCIRSPGASVFDLRAQGIAAARGEFVAITEDHCLVGADWCKEVLQGFAAHPDAMCITGPVLNGSEEFALDRANFLVTFARFLPPCDLSRGDRCPPIANVAIRRSALTASTGTSGGLEFDLMPALLKQDLIRVHSPMTVTHVQSHGVFGTLLSHFDNGRSSTGLRRVPLSSEYLPWNIYWRAIPNGSTPPEVRQRLRKARPLLMVLSCCHSIGLVAGYLTGAGKSPARLR